MILQQAFNHQPITAHMMADFIRTFDEGQFARRIWAVKEAKQKL